LRCMIQSEPSFMIPISCSDSDSVGLHEFFNCPNQPKKKHWPWSCEYNI
jgi:hypothetical protein